MSGCIKGPSGRACRPMRLMLMDKFTGGPPISLWQLPKSLSNSHSLSAYEIESLVRAHYIVCKCSPIVLDLNLCTSGKSSQIKLFSMPLRVLIFPPKLLHWRRLFLKENVIRMTMTHRQRAGRGVRRVHMVCSTRQNKEASFLCCRTELSPTHDLKGDHGRSRHWIEKLIRMEPKRH